MSNTLMSKKEVPTKEYVYEQLRGIILSPAAKSIILCIVDVAGFEFCIMTNQLSKALDLSKQTVEKALAELINIGLVKQQALYGTVRTYILNPSYFSNSRPQRRTRDELKSILKIHSKN